MAKKKHNEESEVEQTEAVASEQPVKKTGQWVAKSNVICGQGVHLKKGDEIPSELLAELQKENLAEQV